MNVHKGISLVVAVVMTMTMFIWQPYGDVFSATINEEADSTNEAIVDETTVDSEDQIIQEGTTEQEETARPEESDSNDEAVMNAQDADVDLSSDGEVINMEAVPDETVDLGISKEGKKLDTTYRTVLIAGIDNGITGIDNSGRSDIVLILSLNKKNNECKAFTVTRDVYMQINDEKVYNIQGKNREFCKCNQALSYGDKYVLMREMNRHLDLNIREFIGVDFACAAKLVDTLNSKGYPTKVNIPDSKLAGSIGLGTGEQTLSGKEAVKYLRARQYKGGSAPVREQRNLDFFTQLFNQTKSMPLTDAIDVYDTIADDLDTNMEPDVLKGMLAMIALSDITVDIQLKHFPGWPYTRIAMWDYPGTGYQLNYFVPVTLTSNVTALHKTVYGGAYEPSDTVEDLSTKIESRINNTLSCSIAAGQGNPVTITANNVTYNGKAQKPKVTVKVRDMVLKEGTHYTVYPRNNKGVGIATLQIAGKGGFSGTRSKSFTIMPKGTKVSKLKKAKKSFTVKWKKQTAKMPKARITGYQIQYSPYKSFKKSSKIATVKGYNKTSKKIGKLMKKKTYYVRIRTYMKVGKTTVYSNWSGIKSVKTK